MQLLRVAARIGSHGNRSRIQDEVLAEDGGHHGAQQGSRGDFVRCPALREDVLHVDGLFAHRPRGLVHAFALGKDRCQRITNPDDLGGGEQVRNDGVAVGVNVGRDGLDLGHACRLHQFDETGGEPEVLGIGRVCVARTLQGRDTFAVLRVSRLQ